MTNQSENQGINDSAAPLASAASPVFSSVDMTAKTDSDLVSQMRKGNSSGSSCLNSLQIDMDDSDTVGSAAQKNNVQELGSSNPADSSKLSWTGLYSDPGFQMQSAGAADIDPGFFRMHSGEPVNDPGFFHAHSGEPVNDPGFFRGHDGARGRDVIDPGHWVSGGNGVHDPGHWVSGGSMVNDPGHWIGGLGHNGSQPFDRAINDPGFETTDGGYEVNDPGIIRSDVGYPVNDPGIIRSDVGYPVNDPGIVRPANRDFPGGLRNSPSNGGSKHRPIRASDLVDDRSLSDIAHGIPSTAGRSLSDIAYNIPASDAARAAGPAKGGRVFPANPNLRPGAGGDNTGGQPSESNPQPTTEDVIRPVEPAPTKKPSPVTIASVELGRRPRGVSPMKP